MDIDPVTVEARLDRLKSACREQGVRMTHQRLEIYREVARTGEHPDAETIFKRVRNRMPTISHDTVYRTLSFLETMGSVNRIDPTGGRARFDANTDEHHHFVCKECGRVSDVYINEPIPLPGGIEELGRAESRHVQIRGLCNNCMSK
jgi:Fur family peroxide stress response transcriptional regulator